jgi:hypothetical protein
MKMNPGRELGRASRRVGEKLCRQSPQDVHYLNAYRLLSFPRQKKAPEASIARLPDALSIGAAGMKKNGLWRRPQGVILIIE